MKKYFGWPAEFLKTGLICLMVLGMERGAFAITTAEISMNSLMQYTPDVRAGDIPAVIRPGVVGPSGIKSTNLASAASVSVISNDLAALSSDVSTIIGNISNSYAMVNGVILPFNNITGDGRPSYANTNPAWVLRYSSDGTNDCWITITNGVLNYNYNPSYLPPSSGWLDSTGGVANITVEFVGGTTALEEAARISGDNLISTNLSGKADTIVFNGTTNSAVSGVVTLPDAGRDYYALTNAPYFGGGDFFFRGSITNSLQFGTNSYVMYSTPSTNAVMTNSWVVSGAGQYIASFETTQTFDRVSSGVVESTLYAYENGAGSCSLVAEVYARINGSTNIVELSSSSQGSVPVAVPAGSTVLPMRWDCGIQDYILSGTNRMSLIVAFKTASVIGTPTVTTFYNDGYASHASIPIPAAVDLSGYVQSGSIEQAVSGSADKIPSSAAVKSAFSGVPRTGIYTHYGFDSLLTSNTVADLTGNGYTATNIGSVILTNGMAVYNVQSNRTVFTPPQSNSFTIATTFVFNQNAPQYQTLFSESVAADFGLPPRGWNVYSNTANSVYMQYRALDATNGTADVPGFEFTPGTNTAVLTCEGNIVKIWMNGVLKTSNTMAYTRSPKTSASIGAFWRNSVLIGGQALSVLDWKMFSPAKSAADSIALSISTNTVIEITAGDSSKLGGIAASAYALTNSLGTMAAQSTNSYLPASSITGTYATVTSLTNYVPTTYLSNVVTKTTNSFSVTLAASDLVFDAGNTTTQEMANVLGTLIKILQGEVLP